MGATDAKVRRIGRARRRQRLGIVCLAILALLANALVPGSLAAALPSSAAIRSIVCSTAPSDEPQTPAPNPGTPAADTGHCLYCLAPATGFLPPSGPTVAVRSAYAVIPPQALVGFALPTHPSNKTNCSRGPPL
jgi:hypothetical protein